MLFFKSLNMAIGEEKKKKREKRIMKGIKIFHSCAAFAVTFIQTRLPSGIMVFYRSYYRSEST